MVLTQSKIAERGGAFQQQHLLFLGRGPEIGSNPESTIYQHRGSGSRFHAFIHQYSVP